MDNINSMMYSGAVPWHKKGVKLEKLANSAEAITAAKLDWYVTKEKLYCLGARVVEDKFATVRSDTKECLGVVGSVYQPLQNKHAFKFFDDVVGEAGAFYETAGCLGKGERIWLLAKLPDSINVRGDISDKYLLLTNSHDGTRSVEVLFTPIRVVCQNTLNVALNGGNNIARIRHCAQTGDKIKYVRDTVGIIQRNFTEFEQVANMLSAKMMTKELLNTYLTKTLKTDEQQEKKLSTRTSNIIEEISALFEHGRGNDKVGIKHTAWAAFNAVTEYVDYSRNVKSDTHDESLLFGSGARLKGRAWEIAKEIAEVK